MVSKVKVTNQGQTCILEGDEGCRFTLKKQNIITVKNFTSSEKLDILLVFWHVRLYVSSVCM